MKKSENIPKHTENRNASDAAVISLVGRFVTFIGLTMYMGRFGIDNPLLNAFTFALLVPNVLSAVVMGLSAVMIPIYNSLKAQDKSDDAKKLIDSIITISMVIIGILVLTGVVAAPWIATIVGGSDFENPEFLTFALRVLMPIMIFFGFVAIFQGLLQSHGVFRLPAFISAPGGIILILYLIFLGDRFGVTGLIFATALGILMQPLIMIRAVRRLGYRYKFSFDTKDENIRTVGKLFIPVLISVASYQMHFVFGQSVATRLGATAIINYSQQLVMVFILTIVYAIASVYLPKLSTLWAEADTHLYNESLKNALLYTLFLVLPATTGFFLLRFDIMDFLLNWRGSYTNHEGIRLAGNLMGLYAIGVIATALKEVADRAFYSQKNSKIPATFGVIIMAANIVITLLLVNVLGTYAMPIAYGTAAVIGSGGLIITLNLRLRFINWAFVFELLKIILATGLMVVTAWFAHSLQFTDIQLVNMLIPAVSGAVVYFVAAFVFKISALSALRGETAK